MKFFVDLEKHIVWSMLYRGGFFGFILMNLSKAYDCLKDDILLAKRQAYGFRKKYKTIFKLSD